MRRRSAGSSRAALQRSDLARGARACISREKEKRVLQFAVYSCNAAHEVTQLAHPRTTSAGQSVVAARPDFGVLAVALLLPPYWHATEPRKHPPTHSSTHL